MLGQVRHPALKARRDALRAAGRCVCGPANGNVGRGGVVHGPPVKGGKCARCVGVHDGPRPQRRGVQVACPVCAAKPGGPCTSPNGKPTRSHQARILAAAALSTGAP